MQHFFVETVSVKVKINDGRLYQSNFIMNLKSLISDKQKWHVKSAGRCIESLCGHPLNTGVLLSCVYNTQA